MNSHGAALFFLRTYAGQRPEEDAGRLAKLIDEFSIGAYRMGLEEAKNVYRELHPGGCRMLRQGDKCKCFLCRIDKRKKEVSQ